jgi:CheY-like chemotaxis protein
MKHGLEAELRETIYRTKVTSVMATKKIMLIDDDPLCILISTKIIELNPALKVISFARAEEALEQLKQWYIAGSDMFPDFIFLDINMPVMDGWQFLEEAQKLPEDFRDKCNVIMLSSSVNPIDVKKSKDFEPVSDFVSKPLTVDKLKHLILKEGEPRPS